jgi:hypothetical protein
MLVGDETGTVAADIADRTADGVDTRIVGGLAADDDGGDVTLTIDVVKNADTSWLNIAESSNKHDRTIGTVMIPPTGDITDGGGGDVTTTTGDAI